MLSIAGQPLGVQAWLVMAVAALVIGFAKTAIGGLGVVSAALFASVLPAKESTGALLPLLMVGDVIAITVYRRHADWPLLLRMFPWVALGTVGGAWFISQVDNATMRRSIGVILLLVVVLNVWGKDQLAARAATARGRRVASGTAGTAAGFTTMVANAAGPVTTIYFLLNGMSKWQFLGTGAWFYFVVNAFKVPFSAGLGLIRPDSLLVNLTLAPAVLVGAAIGIRTVRRINQRLFERLALGLATVAAAALLL